MSKPETDLESLSREQRVESVLATLRGILDEIEIVEPESESPLRALKGPDGAALSDDPHRLTQLSIQCALRLRFIGYPFEEVASLSARQYCERFVGDSYPELPNTSLASGQYALRHGPPLPVVSSAPSNFPIGFVLGCGRSGTTLFRAMLDVHDELWAPGELHLAQYQDMAERAEQIPPVLRYMPVRELASRFGESVDTLSETFRGWETARLPVSDVYERFHAAAPSRLIVDKTPNYSERPEFLERLGRQFPDGRFIFLIRNPHDVIRSIVRMQLYKGVEAFLEPGLNPYQVAEAIWYAHNANIERFFESVPEERRCTVRYEDLVAHPESSLRKVCRLLDRSYDPDMADPYRKRSGRVALGAGDMKVNFLDRVENRPPSAAFYPVGETCRSLAARHGY